ncbi:MAG: hypothetical protein SOZ40_00440 [Ezakiella sp.]|nr:hypothetical protein [Bacillota bacterium]MDY3946452.1 hypothetical protein [Ezakiella sp.]
MKYYLLQLFRDRVSMFWIFIFPILLSTFILQSIGNMNLKEDITMMISPDNPDKIIYEEVFKENTDPDRLTFKLVEGEDYVDALDKKEIVAYLDKDSNLIVSSNSFHESILKNFVDTIKRIKVDPYATIDALSSNNIKSSSDEGADNSGFVFALLAMISFYGSYHGQTIVNNIQANLTPHAIRFAISPSNKWKYLINGFLSAVLVNSMIFTTTLLYLKFILNTDAITNLPLTIIAFLIATIFSICFGLTHAYLINIPEGLKNSINTIVMLVLSAGAGLYGTHFRGSLAKGLGKIAEFNPLKIISDTFFKINMQASPTIGAAIWLIPVSIIIFIICGLKIRRTQYDSL